MQTTNHPVTHSIWHTSFIKMIFPLLLLGCWLMQTSLAHAYTYSNVSTPFSWIDTTSHTKVGYNTTPYKFNNTGGCGTTPPILDDTMSDNIPIGFTFSYGGTGFTQARIMTNGRLQFNNNITCGYGSPVTQLPYADAGLNYTMRIYGNDMDPTPQANATYSTACKLTSTCYISYATTGTAPNRQFVVTWNNVPEWAAGGSTSGNYNLQIILNENGTFIYQYGVNVPGPQATLAQVGWQVSTTDYNVPSVGLPASNTSILFYIPSPIAQYHFQQSAWTAPGQVTDTSGSSPAYNATALGSAVPGVGYACNGAVIPANNGAVVDGINTGIAVPTNLGGAGTIDFWYKANNAWVNGGDTQLVDASISNGQWFFATKLNNGDVRFVITDSTGTIQAVETTANNIAANTWTHIALTWNFNALAASNSDHLSIYINGVQKAISAFTSSGTVSSQIGTLYLGDNRSSFTGSGGTKSSANGTLDEFNIYNVEGGSVLIQRDMNYNASCGPDHYELSLPSSSISCLPTTATITACANSSSPCSSGFIAASNTATLATSAGTLAGNPATFNASGVATVTLNNPTASNNTAVSVTLTSTLLAALSPTKCCPDGINCTVSNSCSTTFNTAGFIFTGIADGTATTIPSQIAGISSATYYLRAIKTNTTTQACQAALQGTTPVNFAYECNDTATCYGANLMSINGGTATTIARNNNASVSSYLPVSMNFDANGNAPFTFNYGDAGKVTLYANKVINSATLAGASNAFAVKPYSFVLTGIKRTADNIANPGASTATGSVFIKASDPFSATVTATTATGTATPSYGHEATPESVKLNSTLAASLNLTSNPAISGTFGAFSNGVATGNNFSWSEAGIITITPDVLDGDYLGAGNTTGTTSGNVGRFTPHHFVTAVTPACATGNFTYSAQPFTVQVTAKNNLATPTTTTNYNSTSNFAKTVTLSDASASTTGTFSNNTIPTSAFASGVATTGIPIYTFTSPATAPTTITLRATDTDSITSSGYTEGTAPIRSGRIKLNNASGSETLNLPVPMVAQYYNGTSFVTNTLDNCTTVPVPTTPNTSTGLSTTLTTTATLSTPFIAGNGNLKLSKPNTKGYVDITIAAPTWLQYNWKGTGLTKPTARATFGIYKNANEFIYMREMY
jgi:MSHA biogenesis protein MshQ